MLNGSHDIAFADRTDLALSLCRYRSALCSPPVMKVPAVDSHIRVSGPPIDPGNPVHRSSQSRLRVKKRVAHSFLSTGCQRGTFTDKQTILIQREKKQD